MDEFEGMSDWDIEHLRSMDSHQAVVRETDSDRSTAAGKGSRNLDDWTPPPQAWIAACHLTFAAALAEDGTS